MGFSNWLRSFMAGRNGTDALFYFLFVLYFCLTGINHLILSPAIYYIRLIVLIWAIFRVFSKNLVKRRKENEAFKRIFAKFVPNGTMYKKRLLEGKTHSFHECPYCGAILRFKRQKGKFNVTCPRCQHKITIRNWF